ncbi:MAG TPA: NnrS family protein [Ramlibacter sp.]|nr:NnrS family protein [Ramlibacter sp.]
MPATNGWRWRHLLDSPHRLGFFLAMLVLGVSGLWWAGVQLARSGFVPAVPMAVSPSLVHAALMTFGFFPLFFCGFLFTAGPRWLHVRAPTTRELMPALLAQGAGWLIWLVGSHVHVLLAVAGLALAAAGLLRAAVRFWRLIHASSDTDRVHPTVIAGALALGCACIASTAVALALGADMLARLFVLTGLWGCVAVVFVTAGHRMIPFFTAPPGTVLERGGDWWQLALLVGISLFEAVCVWLADPLAGVGAWHVARGVIEMATGSVLLWGAVAWTFARSLRNRLLRMLHTGMLWIALGLLLQGVTGVLAWRLGSPVLPLAPLHAFAMGGLGSVMLAMITRVSAGHAGIPVAVDHVVWALFWLLQLATALRVAATVPGTPAQALLTAAALVWAGVAIAWALRYGSGYGRPPATTRRR